MGRPKPQPSGKVYFYDEAQAIDRTQATKGQIWSKENTIIYGDNDDLPLRILDAVNNSPIATACLDKVETYIRGDGFTDEGLMTLPVDTKGTTLWALHKELCKYLAKLEGFSTRFTFSGSGKITNTFPINLESLRFVAPENERSNEIKKIKYNPYFGTSEHKEDFTRDYHLWSPEGLKEQIKEGHNFLGQVYYYGSLTPPFKFYPRPQYWSAQKWIYTDNNIQIFHNSNTENGFFLSSLMTMIGDPNAISKNPKYFSEVTGDDGVKRRENVRKVTVGEEFDESMSAMFSGTKAAGRAMVQWVRTPEDKPNIEPFPANTNFDVFAGTLLDTMRAITTATQVPAILANLPQQVSSLGSDGKSMQTAVKLLQDAVRGRQLTLEEFYNWILLPGMGVTQEVKIKRYNPIEEPFELPPDIWAWLNEEEKISFVTNQYPQIIVSRGTPTIEGTASSQVDENIKNLKTSEIDRLLSVVRRFERGKLTLDQARQLLAGYGLDDEQIKSWIDETVT